MVAGRWRKMGRLEIDSQTEVAGVSCTCGAVRKREKGYPQASGAQEHWGHRAE